MNKVILVGTLHPIQKNFDSTDFENYIKSLVRKYDVKVIAEEIDSDSVAAKISKEFNIGYLVIEPTLQERRSLGIPTLNDIDYSIFMEFDDLTLEEIETESTKRKDEAFRQREKEWLKRINKLSSFPIIAVIGANHFIPFCELLKLNNYEVVEECPLWE